MIDRRSSATALYKPPVPGLPSTPPADPIEEPPLPPADDPPVVEPEPSTPIPSPVTSPFA